jgi:HK97 family phage major capsid protein
MEIQTFIEQTTRGPITLPELTALAADRRAHGDDVVAAFATQAQLRSVQAQTVLDSATQAGRDTLLASEQRSYDTNLRERDAILGLQRHVEQRAAQVAYVPPTQVAAENRIEIVSPVLTREQRCLDYIRQRGGARYTGERGSDSARFGAIVRALALGDRRGLTEFEQRALSEGTDAAGGYSVPEVLAGAFIDRVRNSMVVMRAGAQTVPMTSDTLHIARLAQPGIHTGSPAANAAVGGWKAENDPITEADLTLERVTFTARTLPLLIKMSVELSEDSQNIDAVIEREMSAAMALELDRVALLGSGTAPEPRGVLNQSGVSVVALNATPTDYDFIVDAIGRVWSNNHEPNARIYNATLATLIAKFKSTVDAQPLRVPDVVAAVPAYRTNQIPDAGTSPDDTSLFVGDFTNLLIGLRTSFRLEVSRVAGDAFDNLQIAVRAYLRADVQLAHPEAFDVTTDVGV